MTTAPATPTDPPAARNADRPREGVQDQPSDGQVPSSRRGCDQATQTLRKPINQDRIDAQLTRQISHGFPAPLQRRPASWAGQLVPLALAWLLAACPTVGPSTEPTPDEPTPDEPTPAQDDADGDGYDQDEDCDDDDPLTYPGALEACDGKDNNCSGGISALERDEDGDGQRPCEGDCDDFDPNVVQTTDVDADGVTVCDGDCADADPQRYPGNPEVDACDGIDHDCVPDPGEADADGDGALA